MNGCFDPSGNCCLPVFAGRWLVQADNDELNGYGMQTVPSHEVVAHGTGQSDPVHFASSPISGDFRDARFLEPELLPGGGLRLNLRAQTSLTWRIERSNDLLNWTPLSIQTAVNASLLIEDKPSSSIRTAFYRAVWVR